MKERRSRASKVHFQHNGNHRTLCGLDGRTTYMVNAMTCRVCMFHYLAESASWARRFLDDLRGKPAVRPRGRDRDVVTFGEYVRRTREEFAPIGSLAELQAQAQEYMAPPTHAALTSLGGELAGSGQGHAVAVPAGATAPVNRQEKGLGDGFRRAFGHKGDPQKAIRELLTVTAALLGPVQPVMERRGAPADAIRVKEGQVAEQAGNAGQVGNEASGNFQAPE